MAAREAKKLLIISHYERPVYKEQFVQQPDGSIKKESVDTGEKEHAGYGDIAYAVDQHLQLYFKNTNLEPITGRELLPEKLTTFARFLKPNPPPVYGMELPEPNYERLMQFIDGIKRMSLMEME